MFGKGYFIYYTVISNNNWYEEQLFYKTIKHFKTLKELIFLTQFTFG